MKYIFLGKRVRLSVFLPLTLYLWVIFAGYETALSSLFAVAVHEAGHILAGLLMKRKISAVTLSPLGADIKYAGVVSYETELFSALAGPVFSLISGFLLYGAFYEFAVISVIYGAVNLIPVPCFDGGRALRCTVYRWTGVLKADMICDTVNVVFLIIMYLFSVFLLFYTSFNASLLFICAYIFIKNFLV